MEVTVVAKKIEGALFGMSFALGTMDVLAYDYRTSWFWIGVMFQLYAIRGIKELRRC